MKILSDRNKKIEEENYNFLINTANNYPCNSVIISKSGDVMFINKRTELWLTKFGGGLVPENLSEIIAEYDTNRFFNAISQS